VEFFIFDNAYVNGCGEGILDRATLCSLFWATSAHQAPLQAAASDKVDDLRQETFIRVIAALHREGGCVSRSASELSLTPFVTTSYWSTTDLPPKNQPMEDAPHGHAGQGIEPGGHAGHQDPRSTCAGSWTALPKRDRDLLRAIFLEEKEKDVVCREMGSIAST